MLCLMEEFDLFRAPVRSLFEFLLMISSRPDQATLRVTIDQPVRTFSPSPTLQQGRALAVPTLLQATVKWHSKTLSCSGATVALLSANPSTTAILILKKTI